MVLGTYKSDALVTEPATSKKEIGSGQVVDWPHRPHRMYGKSDYEVALERRALAEDLHRKRVARLVREIKASHTSLEELEVIYGDDCPDLFTEAVKADVRRELARLREAS